MNYPPSTVEPVKNKKSLYLFFFIGIPFLILCGAFFFWFIEKNDTNVPLPTPFPSVSARPSISISPMAGKGLFEKISFHEGKSYYSDEFILISKTDPLFGISAYVTRSQDNSNFVQRVTVFVFHNGSWKKYSSSDTSESPDIIAGNVLKKWSSLIRTSKTLEEKAEVQIETDEPITIQSDIFTNEIAVRSLPSYTKFISEGNAHYTYGNKSGEAHIAYTRIYSNNIDMTPFNNASFYDPKNTFTTDWLEFWDMDGNFYFVDSTNVQNISIPNYTSHVIGVYKDAQKQFIQKTFDVRIQRDNNLRPDSFTFFFGTPINKEVAIVVSNKQNRLQNNIFKDWFFGITRPQGEYMPSGIIEYIYN